MRISVVTPSYGQPDWLPLCVASVADQTSAAHAAPLFLEHLVQDGGTPGIKKTLPTPAPRKEYNLSIRSEPDDGMYDAINKGLSRANGEVCAWLNCDEQYLPGTLATVAAFFQARPDIDILFADAILTSEGGEPLSYRRIIPPDPEHMRLCHLGTMSCATFFRKTIFTDGIHFDTRWKCIGDAVWIEHIVRNGYRMACLRSPLSTFAFTGGNLSAESRAMREMEDWAKEGGGSSSIQTVLAKWRHRFRKFLAGAYRRRMVNYRIYTRRHPGERQFFSAPSLGWGWPGNTESSR